MNWYFSTFHYSRSQGDSADIFKKKYGSNRWQDNWYALYIPRCTWASAVALQPTDIYYHPFICCRAAAKWRQVHLFHNSETEQLIWIFRLHIILDFLFVVFVILGEKSRGLLGNNSQIDTQDIANMVIIKFFIWSGRKLNSGSCLSPQSASVVAAWSPWVG